MNLLNQKFTILVFLFLLYGQGLFAQKDTLIERSNVAKLIEFSENTYADEILVVHQNKVVCHWINDQCDSVLFNTASMVKSWTGLVIGIMVDKGLIESEDDLVCKYLPEWEDGCKYHVSIKNLLTMSAGLNRRSGALGILAVEDMHQYALNVKLDTLPNIRFNYSNESVQLLGLIIERLSGKSANDYFQEVLFEPLGMDSTRLGKDPLRKDVTFGGAMTTIEDALKIGMIMANGGKYRSKQIVSEEWIRKSISPSEKAAFYGYLWWIDHNSENHNFAATGDFGQMTIVFPELDLIYLRKQSCNKDISGNMTWMGPNFLKLLASIVKKK